MTSPRTTTTTTTTALAQTDTTLIRLIQDYLQERQQQLTSKPEETKDVLKLVESEVDQLCNDIIGPYKSLLRSIISDVDTLNGMLSSSCPDNSDSCVRLSITGSNTKIQKPQNVTLGKSLISEIGSDRALEIDESENDSEPDNNKSKIASSLPKNLDEQQHQQNDYQHNSDINLLQTTVVPSTPPPTHSAFVFSEDSPIEISVMSFDTDNSDNTNDDNTNTINDNGDDTMTTIHPVLLPADLATNNDRSTPNYPTGAPNMFLSDRSTNRKRKKKDLEVESDAIDVKFPRNMTVSEFINIWMEGSMTNGVPMKQFWDSHPGWRSRNTQRYYSLSRVGDVVSRVKKLYLESHPNETSTINSRVAMIIESYLENSGIFSISRWSRSPALIQRQPGKNSKENRFLEAQKVLNLYESRKL